MYKIQIKRSWNTVPDWVTVATFTDKEQAERELDRLTGSEFEVRLVNEAYDVYDMKGDENT